MTRTHAHAELLEDVAYKLRHLEAQKVAGENIVIEVKVLSQPGNVYGDGDSRGRTLGTFFALGQYLLEEEPPQLTQQQIAAAIETTRGWAANHGESPHQEGCEKEHGVDEPCE